MNKLLANQRLWLGLLIGALLLPGTAVAIGKNEGRDPLTAPAKTDGPTPGSSVSFGFDNDILVPGSRDQDYTYGINITYAGPDAEDQMVLLHESLGWLDQRIGIDFGINAEIETSKVEYGLFGFTPEDIALSEAAQDDRPYASLIYVSSSRERYDPSRQVSWQSTLTVGVMGLDLVGEIQNTVHAMTGSDRAEGWDNQISAGGEPTARYSISRQNLLYKSGSGLELKSTVQGSVGYITETSWSLSARIGNIRTPWVSFNPELTSYGEKSSPASDGKVSEQYFWAGVAFKARLYNAFLEGQFRDSEVTYASNEINHGIVEAWLGYTVGLNDGYSITYSVRGHTSEIDSGKGDRNVVWGGVLLTRTFS